jgi:TatD DNase family protein
MIDTHINIHHEDYSDDRSDVLHRARAAGVTGFVAICDQISNAEIIRTIVADEPDMVRSVGAHPHYAKDHRDLTPRVLQDLAAKTPFARAIGETGLDQHYGYSDLEAQIEVFRAHIAAARALNLPVIVHTREADELTAKILEDETEKGAFPILLHCYTSGLDLLRRGLTLGAMVSFSGIATFKNASGVRDAVSITPLDRMVIETDGPYLAPIPMRGRRNEPAYLPHIADFIARYLRVEQDRFVAETTKNARALFGFDV